MKLASFFDRVDGNRKDSLDQVVSATEVLDALPWLKDNDFLFLATNFSDIDLDGNYKLSWYEFEVFCGHAVDRIRNMDVLHAHPSEIVRILRKPLLVVALLSSLVLGELVGILQVIVKHAFRCDIDNTNKQQHTNNKQTQ